jgi:DNA-binding beta-propeller fold protein YncE/mono/diheme cytochrome c family protein
LQKPASLDYLEAMIRAACQELRGCQPWCRGLNLTRRTGTLVVLGLALVRGQSEVARGAEWIAPLALVFGSDGQTLHLAGARGRLVVTVEAATGKVSRATPLDDEPTGLALSPDGAQLAVTCSGSTHLVMSLDANTDQVTRRLPTGAGVCSPVFNRAGSMLYVCLRFENAVVAIDWTTGCEQARLHTPREPIAAALTPDERLLVVAHHLPEGSANRRIVAASVTLVDTASFTGRTNLALPNGSVALRGVAISPSGKWAAVTHQLARFQVPTTQVEHGWMNDSALSLINLKTLSVQHTLLLDEPTHGAANPWAVAWTSDEHWLCITHSGTHELSVIDAPALLSKLAQGPAGRVIDDLSFLQGVRRRIPLKGNGPRCLAVRNNRVWIGGFFSDSLEVIDLLPGTAPPVIRLTEHTTGSVQRDGERLFHDATISHQSWQSCASCHPDGRADGLNWDLLNDGIGNPKNTKSLLLAHRTPPAMSHGVRGNAEKAVRSGLRNILFALRPEAEAVAIDEYLKALRPVPNPYLVGGGLSEAARRGHRLFEDPKVGCQGCHPGPLFTDLKAYAVGTANQQDQSRQKFDTPTLVECWRTAPYLHDGSAVTLEEVLTARNPRDKHGCTSHLTAAEIQDLAAYVRSL